MIKQELIELIQHRLAGGDMTPDLEGRYHSEVISKWIDMAIQTIETNSELQSRFGDMLYLNRNIKAFNNVPVLYDTTRAECYSNLPASVVNSTRDRGVKMIAPMQDQKNKFIYRENNSASVFDDLDVGILIETHRYYVEFPKVYYWDKMTQNNKPDNVLMKLIVPFSELEDTDEVNIPGNAMAMVDMILRVLGIMPPEDTANDNVSKQV